MPKYLLALYDDPTQWQQLSAENIQKVIEKYNAWTERLRQAGRLVASEKLTDDGGRIMRKRGDDVRVTDGPFTETKEVLGGFYLIEATNYDEAVAQCRDCPHLQYGTIELRQIDVM